MNEQDRNRPRLDDLNGATRAWPPWFQWCFVIALAIGAVASDWYCAFEWFSRKYSFCSEPVLYRMLLIVLSCASIGFLATFPRGTRWQVGVVVFFSVSITVSGNLLLWWVGHR